MKQSTAVHVKLVKLLDEQAITTTKGHFVTEKRKKPLTEDFSWWCSENPGFLMKNLPMQKYGYI